MKLRLQDTSRRFDQLFDQILNEHMGANKEEEYKDLVDVLLEVQRNGSDEMPLTTDNIQAIILLPPGITAKDLDLTEVFGISMHRREHLHVVAKPYFP
ncbi:hypothetical protein JHK85_011028 [Glycine max]|nr:hypothetical protein JHK85_011028 [Glycine max]